MDTVVSSGVLVVGSADGDSASLTTTVGVAIDARSALGKVTIGVKMPLPGGGAAEVGATFNVTGNLYSNSITQTNNYVCEKEEATI